MYATALRQAMENNKFVYNIYKKDFAEKILQFRLQFVARCLLNVSFQNPFQSYKLGSWPVAAGRGRVAPPLVVGEVGRANNDLHAAASARESRVSKPEVSHVRRR